MRSHKCKCGRKTLKLMKGLCGKCYSNANPGKFAPKVQKANTNTMTEADVKAMIAQNSASMPGHANRQGSGTPRDKSQSALRIFKGAKKILSR